MDTRGGYMGPCNEKTLTGPACSVMKVLLSCEWIHTHLSPFCLLAFPTKSILSILTKNKKKEGVGEASQTTSHGVKHLHAKTWCEFLMKQQLSCFTPTTCSQTLPLHQPGKAQLSFLSPSFCLSVLFKAQCSSQRWTMMYVLHFGID